MTTSSDVSVEEQIQALLMEKERRRRERLAEAAAKSNQVSIWTPDGGVYVNRETGRHYEPHHEDEARFVYSDRPRYFLCRGGEGSGKSVAGVIKDLERLRRGCPGIMGSPDFEHFKRSLWPEFQRWCPPDAVVPRQRYRLKESWTPNAPFQLVFRVPGTNRTVALICGGFDDPASWEGPNVNFAHFDEARRHKEPSMLKVLDGRVRIPGPDMGFGRVPSQLYFTTTPKKHWLFDYFGPWEGEDGSEDPLAVFKSRADNIILRQEDNIANLEEEYIEAREGTLSAAEARVLMNAEWEDIDDASPLLTSMTWWDNCKADIPALTPNDPMILVIDAATGRKSASSDYFTLVGVTRHWDPELAENCVAVRYINYWRAKPGKKIHFRGTEEEPGPIREVERLCEHFSVVALVFDPTQMIAVAQDLQDAGVWCWEFAQQGERLEADLLLLELIVQQRIFHNGDSMMRQHIANSDRKVEEGEKSMSARRKFRIVKGRGNIDLAVTLSMGAKRCLDLNI
jgi:hypothetical protein